MHSYKGKFNPSNKDKYNGSMPIIFRSRLEFFVMRWCDQNQNIKKWASESVIVPYISPIDNKIHRYFIDFVIEFSNNKKYLIEIKPKSQILEPRQNKNGTITNRYIRECCEYAKNRAKWDAATEYAKDNGFVFWVWSEEDLEKLNICKI